MNGMMMAASSREQNAVASVNASDAGRERFTTRYEERRGSPWNSGKGAGGQREVRAVWKGDGSASWAASFAGQKGEPSLAVLLRPWIYDQFQTFPEERRTLGIKR